MNAYTRLIYGIYYSFEVFPIVYIGIYRFKLGQMGLFFLSIAVALAIAVPLHFLYPHTIFEPEVKKKDFLPTEHWLNQSLLPASCHPLTSSHSAGQLEAASTGWYQ